MDLQLAGQRALVTGSTAGIGFAIAQALAAEGAQVIVNGRTQERVDAALARLRTACPQAQISGIAADLGNAAGVAQLLEALPDVDILVNNLGIFFPFKPFDTMPDSEWFLLFETNVMSGVRLSRHYLPRMKARDWGRIIFISSESGITPQPNMMHYSMTKSAQLSVSRALAEDCAGTGVTVNAVLPGPTLTEGIMAFIEPLAQQNKQSIEETGRQFVTSARPTSIIKRLIKPEEVAATVTYLCSPLAAATTGAAIHSEGGTIVSLI